MRGAGRGADVVRCVRETETLFEMENGLRLSKKGLSEAAQAKIRRGMKSYAEGGLVESEEDLLRRWAGVGAPSPVPAFDPAALMHPTAPGTFPSPPMGFNGGPAGPVLDVRGTDGSAPGPGPLAGAVPAMLETLAPVAGQAAIGMLPAVGPTLSAAVPAGRAIRDFNDATPVEPLDVKPGETMPMDAAPADGDIFDTSQVDELTAAMSQSAAMPPMPGAPRIEAPTVDTSAFDKALAERTAALEAKAAVDQEQAAAEAAIGERRAQTIEAERAKYLQTREALQKRGDELRTSIMKAEIDPNRFFASMSTGQRVASLAGVLISGIGQGLMAASGRGVAPNMALALMEKAIDRDIEAQRANLGKQETLLNHHLRELGDHDAAYAATKAHLMDAASAQLSTIAAKYGGQKAAANAQGIAAELQQQAAQWRSGQLQQALENNLRTRLAEEEIRARRASVQESMAKIAATQLEQRKGVLSVAAEAAALAGKAIPPAANRLLSKETRNVMVRMPNGFLRAATDHEGKKKVDAALVSFQDFTNSLRRYEEIRAKNPRGWQVGLSNRDDMKEAGQLFEKLRTQLAKMSETGVLTDQDLVRYGKIVPDITESSVVLDTKERQLGALRGIVASKLQSHLDTHLVKPEQLPQAGTIPQRAPGR